MRPNFVKLKNFDNHFPLGASNTLRKLKSYPEVNGWHEPDACNSEKKVAILLATYQGEKFLAEQLNSFAAQTHQNWELWVSDDGSTDETIKVLENFSSRSESYHHNIGFGPKRGFAANFLSLTCDSRISADYYAYSDQDDIWDKDKLERAVQWLESVSENVPAMYCCRSRLVDENNNEIGYSALFSRQPSFSNALVQTIGGANTIVFNEAARNLVRKIGCDHQIVSHDWWIYLLVTGVGGRVFYDSTPRIRYRQHKHNLVGANTTVKGKLKRIRMLFRGDFARNNEINLHALLNLQAMLTPENRRILNQFKASRKASLVNRLMMLKKNGVYRQTILGNIGLLFAALFRKI